MPLPSVMAVIAHAGYRRGPAWVGVGLGVEFRVAVGVGVGVRVLISHLALIRQGQGLIMRGMHVTLTLT